MKRVLVVLALLVLVVALPACATSFKGPLGGTFTMSYEPPVSLGLAPLEAVKPHPPVEPAAAPAPAPTSPAPASPAPATPPVQAAPPAK